MNNEVSNNNEIPPFLHQNSNPDFLEQQESITQAENLLQNSMEKHTKESSPRVKSSQRLLYEAEVEIFKKKVGDLEQIRINLGLSQRKICQLLLVDPSAWTRWTKQGEKAPPHIYRSLQWYMGLIDKYPEFKNPYWLSTVAHVRDQKTLSWEKDKTNFLDRTRREFFDLHQDISHKLKKVTYINKILAGAVGLLFIYAFFIKK